MSYTNHDLHIKEPISKKTNIYQYPTEIAQYPADSVVTLGDLHGNAAKFLHLLVNEGFIDINQTNYHGLIAIYDESHQDNYNLHDFKILLDKIMVKNLSPKLRLIGDDLADRGKNDLLTLLIFEKLNKLNIRIEIIASNHGIEFLKQYAYGINNSLKILYQGINQSFGNSLYGLRKDMNKNKPLVMVNEVENLIQENYLPNLKLLSYAINHTSITIYTHAPITANKIRLLAKLFQTDYNDRTINELAQSIDSINSGFKKIIMNKEKLKYFFDILEKEKEKCKIFDDFTNDRYNDLLNNLVANPKFEYKVINVHGHVGAQIQSKLFFDNWFYINLDTDLGKSEKLNKNTYLVRVSNESW